MKHRKRFFAFALAALLLAGCGAQQTAQDAEPEAPETAEEPAADTSKVADASEMTTVEDVVEEGMVPVYADALNEGTYTVAVESSSSMFRVTECELTVAAGEMNALLTLGGSSYAYLYPGTAEEAAAADTRDLLPAEESPEGTNAFAFPVPALDAGVDCAAFSKNKEQWYPRTLVFRADSLPLDAFRDLTTAESLGLEDGAYTVSVALSGGSGKASVASPANLTVEGGQAAVELVWSSDHYDYMRVDGELYEPEFVDGHSVFVIPAPVFDRPFAVTADTTAMSQPHEIEYTLTLDAGSLNRQTP